MNCTPLYTAIQSLYWATYCMMFNYAASFLQEKGLSNSQTGLILGLCYACSALVQPLFISFIERKKQHIAKGILLVCCAIALLSLTILLPIGTTGIAILFTMAITLQHAMQSSVNSLHHTLAANGARVNFEFARGMGSTVFALIALLIGNLLKFVSTGILPVLYFTTTIGMIVLLQKATGANGAAPVQEHGRQGGLLEPLRYVPFVLFLCGVIAIYIGHIFIDNFMLKIMQNIGGGNAQLGTAIAIAAIVELPGMMLYRRLRKRFSCAVLIGFASCVWALKHLLILMAKTPAVIYLCEVLQFFSYSFYVPAGVEFVGHVLPEHLYLRGQALFGTAYSLGCMSATLVGGWLLDKVGLHTTLILFVSFSALGAVLFILAGIRCRKAGN